MNLLLKLSFCCFVAFLCFDVQGNNKPIVLDVLVQELPREFDPAKALDVFSISLSVQLHKTLFVLDEYGTPQPNLLRDFDVSNQGKFYTFELDTTSYPSLTATDVKKSLIHSIKSKSPRFETLENLIGFDDFVKNKVKDIKGIKILDNKRFSLEFKKVNYEVLYLLSDIRYSIKKYTRDGIESLGDFEIIEKNHRSILLKNKTKKNIFVKYTTSCESSNPYRISLFGEKFNCDSKNVSQIKFNSYRDYLFHLNARTLKHNERKYIAWKIAREKLLDKCFPNEKISNNFVPRGFAGYLENNSIAYKEPSSFKLKKKIKIQIAKGIENPNCVANYLTDVLSADVEILNTEDIIKSWLRNKTDIIFWYLESEQKFNHINYFLPRNSLKLGLGEDQKIEIPSKQRGVQYFSKMGDIGRKILDSFVVIPVFKPVNFVYHTKCIKVQKSLYSSATYLSLKDLIFDEKC